MATPRIMPLGFIDRTTGDGAIIMLTNPEESSHSEARHSGHPMAVQPSTAGRRQNPGRNQRTWDT